MSYAETAGERVDVAAELRRLEGHTGPVGGAAVEAFLEESKPKRRDRKGGNTVVSIHIERIGETDPIHKRMTIGFFTRLSDRMKLLVAVGMAKDRHFEGVFDDEQAEKEFLLKMVNKGKTPNATNPGPLVDEAGVEAMMEDHVAEGNMRLDETGAHHLTEQGLQEIHNRTKEPGSNYY